MKKLLLLPTLLLAACASMAAPVAPLAPGDVLTLTGTTRSKEAVNVTLTVRTRGERDRDGDWEYDADGAKPDSAVIFVDGEQDFVMAVDSSDVVDDGGTRHETILACFAAPSGPGWRTAEGYLVQGDRMSFQILGQRLKSQSELAGLKTLAENAGDCHLTRK
ncbi:hypothetical protein DAETH_02490 [Deinococcus aetherius]|uniref:Lipoprotein n=1 Tax=Deinococcus aetherius TaxID=200252 RepID=A0ABN6RAA2_9DEIO|nr:hypothetical protein [Deinococcus aetherius]BDP40280.1 hypothetical protein DAETH_02490 [Deinococcus aetherius]